MKNTVAGLLFTSAIVGLFLSLVQLTLVAIARRKKRRPPLVNRPPISILKPLCGLDDELQENLESFLALEYPVFELLLGVKDTADPAYALARAFARRAPGIVRVVLQRGAPGLNPKINQLITLERASRHQLLVVSDSNVRVTPDYLDDIARAACDPKVGLVTHAIVGAGGKDRGARLDNLHMSSLIGPAIVATGLLPGAALVVGKSMALRRDLLERIGGFIAFKDLLAEDYAIGRAIKSDLKLRVAIGQARIENITINRRAAEFYDRYRRWAVMHRQAIGPLPYVCELLLLPIVLAAAAFTLAPTTDSLFLLSAVVTAKFALDVATVRALSGKLPPAGLLADSLVKEALLFGAWVYGLSRSTINWRGNLLRVERGTHMRPIETPAEAREEVAA